MQGSSARWQAVRERFLEALEREGAERAAWLEELRRADEETWREVSALLAAHAGENAVLDHVAADFVSPELFAAQESRWSGRRIGSYVIVELLGRGGMGEVYRAHRADAQYEKAVAIKVVRAGFDSGDILRRFRVERQILANLEHPNIAHLLDGGSTDEGLPYLVMELIEGERIDLYCDRHRLAVRQRLRLFLKVCEAVQFAHQRLVIHRDLKTSNVLVTRQGEPKLLDFGVAKLVSSADAATETTLFRPLTPAYASPEQLRGESLTTASDVYSLGVVLFELLTGRSPFAAHARTLQGATQREGTVLRSPSATVRSSARASAGNSAEADPETIAAARSTTAVRLERQLAGDLDAILMKALRVEPEHRYASAQQLAEDLERHLEGAPVNAHRGSWRYRLGKFVGRNKAAVGGAAAALLALSAGLIVSVHQAHVARAERQRADARFEDVRKLANGLVFDVNDAMADTPGNTAARKLLLDRAVQYLDKLSQDAGGDTDLQRELAIGYQRLAAVLGNTTESNVGEISAADQTLHKAITLFEAVYRANPTRVEDGLNLAMIHRLMGASDIYYPSGPPEIARASDILDALSRLKPDDEKLALERCRTYDLLGYSQDLSGRRLDSVASIRKALLLGQGLLQREPHPPGVEEMIATYTVHLGAQLSRVGSQQAAEVALQDGVRQLERLRQQRGTPQLARNTAHAQTLLGRVNALRGSLADAEGNFTTAAAVANGLLKLDPQNSMFAWDVVTLSFEHGRVLALRGLTEESLPDIQPAIARYMQPHEDDSGPGLGLLKAWSAFAHYRAGRFAQAREQLNESVAALKEEPLYSDARSGLAADQVLIGESLLQEQNLAGARAAFTEVLSGADVADIVRRGDVPMLYALAGAQAGLGDVFAAEAEALADPDARAQRLREACSSYRASDAIWGAVTEPATYSPDQFPSGSRADLRARLSHCATVRGASSS